MSALSSSGSHEGRLLRRLTQAAKQAAFQGQWQRAIELNQKITELAPRDVAAWNRLGHAYAELGRVAEAQAAYQRALEIEPTNPIAQRNVARLDWLVGQTADGAVPMPIRSSAPRADVFMEEMGRTYVTDLLRPAPPAVLARIFPGQEVTLTFTDNAVYVCDADGARLGQLEGRLARRLRHFHAEGNQYRAFVLQLTGETLRIILREVFHAPHLLGVPSFPPQTKIAPPRPYVTKHEEEEEIYAEEGAELLELGEEEAEIEEEEEEELAEELLAEDEPLLTELPIDDALDE